MIILAIDPGVRADLRRRRDPIDPRVCACAWVSHERLIDAYFAAPGAPFEGRRAPLCRPEIILVERPEYQGARTDAANTADTIALAWSGAQAAYLASGATGAPVQEATPGEWKGSEAKPPQHLRLWEDCLTADEKKLFSADMGMRIMKAAEKYALQPGKPGVSYYGRWGGHNLLDAAALGLAFVGRFR